MENNEQKQESATSAIVHILLGLIIAIGAYIAYTKSGLPAIYKGGGRIYMYGIIAGLLIIFTGLNLLRQYFSSKSK